MSPGGSSGIELEPQGLIPVLFTHFGDRWIRGSETLLLDLLKHLDLSRFRPVVWCNGTEMAAACHDAGFETHRTEFAHYFDADSPRFSPRRYVALVREGRSLVRRYGIRVLHANSAAPTQWLLPVARSARVPLLTHLHIGYLRRSRYALLLHQADMIVGVSRQVVADPIGDGTPVARTQVIYNGIDFARMTTPPGTDLRPELGIPADAVVIGAVGSLIHRKGYDILVRALSVLPRNRPPHLLIAGDGPEQGALQGLAQQLGIADRVHFLGFRNPVSDVYRSCDIVALASRAEAFGLVLAEAGYSYRPVVATRVGGIPEVIVEGSTGYLVPPDDVEAMAGALSRLTQDPALRAAFGLAGRARAEAAFSAQRMAMEFHAIYERLARLPRRRLGWGAVVRKSGVYARLLRGR